MQKAVHRVISLLLEFMSHLVALLQTAFDRKQVDCKKPDVLYEKGGLLLR